STSVTKVNPGQMNARTPNTIAAMPRNNRSHQHLASACSIGRSGNERGISRAACIEISSSKHCRETTQISVPEELDYRPFSFKSTQEDNDVRFGSKADICGAKRHVRFTPNSDRESEIPQKAMSALPPLWANSGHDGSLDNFVSALLER